MAGLGKLGGVLDEAGEETAALLLQLQLEDLASSKADEGSDGVQGDLALACKLFEDELKEYQELRGIELNKVVSFKCIICEDDFSADNCYQVPCQHYYCDACLNDLFKTAMKHEDLYPPRCCRQIIPFNDVRFFLDLKLVADMDAKKEELDDTKKTYCHVATCSAYIGDANKKDDVGTCPRPGCAAQTCLLCKEAGHEGDCIKDEADKQLLELASQEEWKQCPGCGKMIELDTGCNHMTCRCKCEFCYVCGKIWKTCECPQFNEDRLLARGQQIADRNGANIDAVMDNLRVNHECVNHVWEFQPARAQCERCFQTLPTFIFHCTRCELEVCRRCSTAVCETQPCLNMCFAQVN